MYVSGLRVINRAPGFVDARQEIRIPDRARTHEIDIPVEQAGKRIEKIEISVRHAPGRFRAELDQEIQIARLPIEITPRSGAKQLQPLDAIAPSNPGHIVCMSIDDIHGLKIVGTIRKEYPICVEPMTPASQLLDAHNVHYQLHQYEHTTAHSDYGIDASQQLGVAPEQVFKTLVAELDTHALVAAIVPVSGRLHMKSLAAAAHAKKAFMADRAKVEKATGYVLGGVSPLGQKKALASFIDESAIAFDTIFISGGRRGLEIEIEPFALAEAIDALFVAITEQAAG